MNPSSAENTALTPTLLTCSQVRDRLNQLTGELRQRHRWLRHQDAIGLLLLLASIGGMVGAAYAFAIGACGAASVILVNALLSSVPHEVEHDLIHRQYFKKSPVAYHAMMLLCWLSRPTTINPWLRSNLHMHHHKVSGSQSDVEERGLTNGERWGIKRALMTVDGLLALVLRPNSMRKAIKQYHATYPRLKANLLVFAYLPFGFIAFGLWYGFLYDLIAGSSLGAALGLKALPAAVGELARFISIAWIAPNVLRTACLYFVSSNMHYYGDIDSRNVRQQTQVLDAWWLLPANLFCWNFGATHTLHHYQVGEPFYIRTAVAKKGREVLKQAGVRFNDFGTFKRANRWG